MLEAAKLNASDVTATIGFMLTLVGLIGTFFYVHLSNWLREILELKSKYDLNSVGTGAAREEALLECKYQLRRLLNHIPVLITAVISFFIVEVVIIAKNLISAVQPMPPVVPYYESAAKYFLVIYFGLTLYLLLHGYIVAFWLRRKLG